MIVLTSIIQDPVNKLFGTPNVIQYETDNEIRAYHRKRIYELSLKSIRGIPQLDDPNKEQKAWIETRMKDSDRGWEKWFVGQYFTEIQKNEMELTDKDIAGMRMA